MTIRKPMRESGVNQHYKASMIAGIIAVLILQTIINSPVVACQNDDQIEIWDSIHYDDPKK